MSLSRNLAAPLALSFALVGGQAAAEETQVFTCDAPDMSNMTLQDKLEVLMPSNVFIVATQRAVTPPQDAEEGEPEAAPAPPLSQGSGSGFIIDPNGYIVTNNHVVEDATDVTVTFYDPNELNNIGKEVDATVLGTDSALDLALLKVDIDGALPCVNFADSDTVRLGDDALAIGNPLGMQFTFTKGYLSNTMRNIGNPFYDFFQTDAAINPGNSGGGLYNNDGEVIGINSAIISRVGQNSGLGLTIKSNDILEVAEELKMHGEAQRAGLGVQIQDVVAGAAIKMGVEEGVGVLVTRVVPNRPAALSGIEENDIILEFGGAEVNSSAELVRTISAYDPGDDVKVKLLRDGKEFTLEVDLTDRTNAVAGLSEPPVKPETAPAPAPSMR